MDQELLLLGKVISSKRVHATPQELHVFLEKAISVLLEQSTESQPPKQQPHPDHLEE